MLSDKANTLSLCIPDKQSWTAVVQGLESAGLIALVILTMCYDSLNVVVGVFGDTSRYLFVAIMGAFVYFLARSFKDRQIGLLPESALMACWFAWTVSTAMWCHPQPGVGDYSLTSGVFRGPFFCLLFFVMVNSLDPDRSERTVLFGFAIAGAVLTVLGLASGQIGQLSSSPEGRLGQAVAGNANEFAYLLLMAVFAAMYYAFEARTSYGRTMSLLLVLALTVLIILSGSRKAFLGELAFFVMVFRPRYFRASLRKPGYMLGLVVLCVAVLIAGMYILQNTYLGERFRDFAEQDLQKDVPFEQRFDGRGRFYIEAVELVRAYPLFGVGLDNFRYYDQEGYAAHSDYIALIAETGIPGFLLYFSAYLVVLARLRRAIQTCPNRELVFGSHLFWCALVTVLLVGLGRWNYNHIPSYVLLALAGHQAARAAGVVAYPLLWEDGGHGVLRR